MASIVSSRWLWLFALTMALFALASANWVGQTKTPAALPEKPPPRADYYLRDAEIDVLDDNGQLSYRLRTAELLRLNDHSSKLTDVHIESLGGSQGVWTLEAGQANISKNQEHMRLSGGVRMQTQGAGGPTQLITENMNVELKNNKMATRDPVKISGPEYEAQAIGLQANFDSRNLTLLNQVRTRYAP